MAPPLLLSAQDLSKAYGARTLFTGVSLGVFDGDHACLVGPNGSGKSTLLKILAGIEPPDQGTRAVRSGVRVAYVAQDPEFAGGGSVEDALAAALGSVDADARPGRIAVALGRAGFADGRAAIATLSGGWQKRLAIARALAAEPDVLLMDEPTNHLDVDGILWLERLLEDHARAFLVVSHDRYFLERTAGRVLELNPVYPSGLFATDGAYSEFLARRDELLRGQAAYEESLANMVRREIAWLRRGAKARATKAKGRIKEAGRLIEELDDAKARGIGRAAGIELTASQRRTRRLLVARGVHLARGGRALFRALDLTITPGTRVGLLGPNGSGKTSLLDVLAGTLEPDGGVIERADALRIVRFEQHRTALDPTESLRRALAPDGDAVSFQGRSVHVASWAKRFLFRPEQLELPVGRLSGGEQARVLIARVMREPADVLILDEPTNDLDIPTLEVLEDSLAEFEGGLVLVTHDRYMLDRLSTLVVALDGAGGVATFADYAQWERAATARSAAPGPEAPRPAAARERTRAPRLGYLEQREWDGMEQAIHEAEARLQACRQAAEDPAVASDAAALQERLAALAAAEAEVDRLYARWAELEAKTL
ncbi:MAG: ABC-F family ATP-binding cassette domain-containing protein [Candidatus Rokubacteria bacterium]|nr:ABC-F family ATP-binding cassette domain-containing protein [Candidatus Rokubacteria bacterium]